MASKVASTSASTLQSTSNPTSSSSLPRVDTQLLKTQLAAVLGDNGRRYWSALLDFCTAKINRQEFHSIAEQSLHPDHLHFHNSLILGILYNASSDVPGPSSPGLGSATTSKSKRGGRLSNGIQSSSSTTDTDEFNNGEPSRKRLRHLVAGLTTNERARLKNIGQPIKAGLGSATSQPLQGSIANLGWAGAGADLLGKKRREEEKRKTMEEKRKVRELMTDVGSKDWRSSAVQAEAHLSILKEKLPKATQHAICRGLAAPLCSESKELPDVEALRDRMTVQAAEAGLSNGVNPQAAAMLMSALQDHIQNIASNMIEKIRSNRRTGIQTAEPLIPAYLNSVSTHQPEPSGLTYDSPIARGSDLEDNSFSSRPTDLSSYSHSSRASPGNHSLRTMPSDLSSRAGTSISGGGLGVSFLGDSSMASTNTNLTSFGNGTSHDGDHPAEGEDEEGVNASENQARARSKPNGYDHHSLDPNPAGDGSNNLTISDISFLLSLCPTTIVEPIGASNEERLLVPDWSESSQDESNLNQSPFESYSSRSNVAGGDWSLPSDDFLAKVTKLTSSAKMPTNALSSSPSTNSSINQNIGSSRNRYIIDGSAPLKLLDRKTLAETQYLETKGKGRPTKGGLSIGTNSHSNGFNQNGNLDSINGVNTLSGGDSNQNAGGVAPTSPLTPHPNGNNPRKRSYKDELFEVVDPVSLLGALGE